LNINGRNTRATDRKNIIVPTGNGSISQNHLSIVITGEITDITVFIDIIIITMIDFICIDIINESGERESLERFGFVARGDSVWFAGPELVKSSGPFFI
jgi:hypothetical protein